MEILINWILQSMRSHLYRLFQQGWIIEATSLLTQLRYHIISSFKPRRRTVTFDNWVPTCSIKIPISNERGHILPDSIKLHRIDPQEHFILVPHQRRGNLGQQCFPFPFKIRQDDCCNPLLIPVTYITLVVTFQRLFILFDLPLNLIEFLPDLIKLSQFGASLRMETLPDPPPILLEANIQQPIQFLFDLLKLLLHGRIHRILVTLQIPHNVVLLVREFLADTAQFVQALALAVVEVGLPGLPLGDVDLLGDGPVDLGGTDGLAFAVQWPEGVFPVLALAVGEVGLQSGVVAAHFIFIYSLYFESGQEYQSVDSGISQIPSKNLIMFGFSSSKSLNQIFN